MPSRILHQSHSGRDFRLFPAPPSTYRSRDNYSARREHYTVAINAEQVSTQAARLGHSSKIFMGAVHTCPTMYTYMGIFGRIHHPAICTAVCSTPRENKQEFYADMVPLTGELGHAVVAYHKMMAAGSDKVNIGTVQH